MAASPGRSRGRGIAGRGVRGGYRGGGAAAGRRSRDDEPVGPDGAVKVVAAWSSTGAAVPVGTRVGIGGRNVHTLVFQTGRAARLDDYAGVSATAQAWSGSRIGSRRPAAGSRCTARQGRVPSCRSPCPSTTPRQCSDELKPSFFRPDGPLPARQRWPEGMHRSRTCGPGSCRARAGSPGARPGPGRRLAVVRGPWRAALR